MIAIKRRCKFFDHCHFADATSRTCTQDAGGDYCGVFRALELAQKLKEERLKKEKGMKNADKRAVDILQEIEKEKEWNQKRKEQKQDEKKEK